MSENLNEPQSRTEEILQNALGEEYDVTPQSRVEKLLEQIFEGGGAGKGGFEVHICASGEYDATTKVPTIATPDPKTLYLVPSSDTAGNLFDEYIYVDNKWEKFGGVQIEGWAKNIVDGSGDGAVKTKYAIKASGKAAFAEGYNTTASGDYSHAEGNGTTASKLWSHAEGNTTTASGKCSHAEGDNATASGNYSHAEGSWTTASGDYSHAEGASSRVTASYAHAEGYNTYVPGLYAHAEGYGTQALGNQSHTDGDHTQAKFRSQHVFGEYNIIDPSSVSNAAASRGTYVEIIGNGNDSARSNARTLDWSGNEWLAGTLTLGNTTLTEADIIALHTPAEGGEY